jgi:PAS domain S-box-containing protein
MGLEKIDAEYRQLRRYVGWSAEDESRIRRVAPLVMERTEEMVSDFYDEIRRHPETVSVITGGDRQVERLKESLRAWIRDAFTGPYDEQYVHRRWQIGKRHVDIGLMQIFVHAAFSRLRAGILKAIGEGWKGALEELRQTVISVEKLLDLDLAVIQDAFETEYQSRQRPMDEIGVRQQRVVAQISERALSGLPVRDLLDQVVVLLAECFSATCSEVFEIAEEPGRLILRSGYGWPTGLVGALAVDIRTGSEFEFLLGRRRGVACEDWSSESRFRPTLLAARGPVSSSIWVPLLTGEGHAGVLGVHFAQPRLLGPMDSDFVQSVANVIGTALERQRSDQRRQENEERLRRLVDRLPAGAIYLSEGFLYLNRAAEGMTGYGRGELRRLPDWQRIVVRSGVERTAPEESLLGQRSGTVTVRSELIRRRDGQERLIEVTAFRSDSDEVWLVHDITDAEQRRMRAMQAERLAAMGQMIAGLAHESRNALQRIRACTELLEFDLEKSSHALELLGRMGRAQDDLQRLFDEVQGYAAPVRLDRHACRWSSTLEEAWELILSVRSNRDVTLDLVEEGSEIVLVLDRFRMVQVFRILLENSLAACTDPVRIRVWCEKAEVAEPLNGQPAVRIVFQDNGPGLCAEARQHVFEPFFTTKAKGTGLGMAIAQRLVDAHAGRIAWEETDEPGARFAISLPLM